jgi:hypothetical protein
MHWFLRFRLLLKFTAVACSPHHSLSYVNKIRSCLLTATSDL